MEVTSNGYVNVRDVAPPIEPSIMPIGLVSPVSIAALEYTEKQSASHESHLRSAKGCFQVYAELPAELSRFLVY